MEKLNEYQGWTGRLHGLRDKVKERWQEKGNTSICQMLVSKFTATGPSSEPGFGGDPDYSHIYRRKNRTELIRVSSAVMGIEFSYAAETAFVSPTLLKIGVAHQQMTMVWCLSPIVGFFLTPILGSMSDRCRLTFGRRRPFICLLSLGVLLGLLLVPNGEDLGYAFGDVPEQMMNQSAATTNISVILPHRSTASQTTTSAEDSRGAHHPWGIFFTILGTVLLDFDADACQSPARAYLLDVTLPQDHAKGLSTFTIMAGLGGFMGYSLGGINWDDTYIGVALGGHVRAVFTLVTIIFIVCVSLTLTSFAEIPLWMIDADLLKPMTNENEENVEQIEATEKCEMVKSASDATGQLKVDDTPSYGTVDSLQIPKINQRRNTMPPLNQNDYATLPGANVSETTFIETVESIPVPVIPTEEPLKLKHYLLSIIYMPYSLRILCATNLFCWMAHVSYSLYFTDFVGEAVFGGDPRAPPGSYLYTRYEEGIRFGCFGMAMYSLSCACYSFMIEKLIKRFKAKPVYVGGLIFYSCGMTMMALTKHPVGVLLFSWGAGVLYSTLFTLPYLLIAHYHDQGVFAIDPAGELSTGSQVRGLGTDVAIVSSMVFLAQFILSMCMGTIVSWTGTTTAVVSAASFLAFLAAMCATQIMYLDL